MKSYTYPNSRSKITTMCTKVCRPCDFHKTYVYETFARVDSND